MLCIFDSDELNTPNKQEKAMNVALANNKKGEIIFHNSIYYIYIIA